MENELSDAIKILILSAMTFALFLKIENCLSFYCNCYLSAIILIFTLTNLL